MHFKVADGNTQDSTTHIETWEVLRRLVGSPQFLYLADSKLCSRENLYHIHEAGGRFITVLPRTRKEDSQFKKWLLTHTPDWQEIVRYPHPRRKDGPPDILRAMESPIPDADGYRLIWLHSSHKGRETLKGVKIESFGRLKNWISSRPNWRAPDAVIPPLRGLSRQ